MTATALAAAGVLAWGDVRGATLAAGEARLQGTANEIANLARATFATRSNLEQSIGQDPAVQVALRGGTPDEEALQAALRRMAATADSGLPLELWSADRRRVASFGVLPAGVDSTARLDSVRASGEFQVVDQGTLFWTSVPVLAGDRVQGWLVRLARIGNPQTASQFGRLLGADIAFIFGNDQQKSWADLGGALVPAPPPGYPIGQVFTSTLPDDGPALAVAVPLEGTQRILMMQMPMSALESRPQAFVRRMLLAGVVLILGTGLIGWMVSARLTAPLQALAGAADDLARGGYARRVPGEGDDEIARLARAFNSMSDQVERSDEALRQRLEEARALAASLEEANVAAEQAREDAQNADRAKSEFLATMSHEIRTPINAVIGYTELMAQGIPDPPTEKQKGFLERIERSSRLLISLVNDVLDFARIESGEMTVQRGVASAQECILTARAALEPEATQKGVHLTSACDPELLFSADPRRVQQILLNLLTNAVKFTPRGGSVRITCEPDELGPRGTGEGQWLRIDVEDTGIGIAADQVARIFEPFVQGETGFTREHGGVGLGLAISRRLATLLHGDIAVRSTRGQGSCFSLWLPAAGSATPAPPARVPAATV
jgi:signal transduction histidine kinase